VRSERGFTLLEVLIAMAIIATALVALLSLQSRAIRMVDSAEMFQGARLLSERLMSEGELEGVPGGERRGDDGTYRWVLTEIRMTAGVPTLPGRQLSLEMSWKEGRRDEKLNLAEYLYERR
jgi:general secretion pathway protein I